MSWRRLTTALALAACGATAARAQGAADNRAAIREGEIKRDLFKLAGDEFRGREAGTLDEVRASVWLADMAREAGLKPAGDMGSFYQWWGLRRVRLASSSSFALGGVKVPLWSEAVAVSIADGRAEGPVTWVGDAVGSSLDALDIEGKIVAAHVLIPANAPGPNVSLRAWRYAGLAIAQRTLQLQRKGAAAVVLVADSLTEVAWDFLSTVRQRGLYSLDTGSTDQRPDRAMPVLVMHRGAWKQLSERGLTASVDLRTESFTYPSVNVIGMVPGTDPKLANEYVLFSSHQDHDGVRAPVAGDSIYNGADDNATGSVSLLAIARAWVKKPGKRPALFVWHGAEERGLLGSRYHALRPVVPREQIVAVLNAEMMGRNAPDTASLMGVQPPHRNSTDLVAMAIQANTETAKFVIDSTWDRPTHPENWYFRSDHLPYARLGIPSIMFTSVLHPDYHTPRDEPKTIDTAKLTRITTWIYRTGWLVANAPKRPATDPTFKLER
ncbi:MAG: M28 family peptidase [Gemmatimonadetes bacterium]|nr:M28 family peptidase [Gemmatimonadota bacterium]